MGDIFSSIMPKNVPFGANNCRRGILVDCQGGSFSDKGFIFVCGEAPLRSFFFLNAFEMGDYCEKRPNATILRIVKTFIKTDMRRDTGNLEAKQEQRLQVFILFAVRTRG